jgi:hypothetical protein
VEGILLHFRWIQQHSVGLVCDRHRVHGPALRVRAERLLKCSSAPARSGAAPTPVRAGRVLELGLLRRQRLRRQASVELVHDSVLEQEVLVLVLQRDHLRLEEQNTTGRDGCSSTTTSRTSLTSSVTCRTRRRLCARPPPSSCSCSRGRAACSFCSAAALPRPAPNV